MINVMTLNSGIRTVDNRFDDEPEFLSIASLSIIHLQLSQWIEFKVNWKLAEMPIRLL